MRRRNTGIKLIILVLLIFVVGLFYAFRDKYRPVAQSLANTQLKNTTSDLINDAISRQIAADNIRYDRIIYFEKDLNGKITALKTNMAEVNRLKTDILNLINDEILALDTSDLGVPLGSIFLPELFSGKGPQLAVKILSIRNSDAAFTSNFSEAGINQTLQQLIMEVSVDVTILVMGETESYTVSTQVVVAETIIVGEVPDTYFHTGGNYGNTSADPPADG